MNTDACMSFNLKPLIIKKIP